MSAEIPELHAALQDGDLMAALAYLNSRTPHRFTGIFKFSGDLLENLFLFDREQTGAAVWAPFLPEKSYCSIVEATNSTFVLGNSTTDPRVAEHSARDVVMSYCGVPLHNPDGSLFGSLCHFDYKPILFSHLDVPFLESIAPTLMAAILA